MMISLFTHTGVMERVSFVSLFSRGPDDPLFTGVMRGCPSCHFSAADRSGASEAIASQRRA